MLDNLFSNTVYIKVHPNRFELKAIESGKTITLTSPEVFTTTRLLVGQFNVANALLKDGMTQLNVGKWFAPSPAVVIQPMSMVEDGLSQIEGRIFQELAIGSGARKAMVWVGHELSDSEVLEHANSK